MAKSSKATKSSKPTNSSKDSKSSAPAKPAKATKVAKPAKATTAATAESKPEPAELEPADVVRGFIAAMHEWEKGADKTMRAATRAGENGFDPKFGLQAGQDAVFSQFCTTKSRPYGRLSSFSNPPEYQPKHEAILEVKQASPRRAEVHTQQGTGFKHRRIYVLQRQDGQWRIDSVKWQKFDGGWSNGTL